MKRACTFLLFSLLIVSNGIMQAQQKTVEEERRELEELLRRQKDLMNQPANAIPAKEVSPDTIDPVEKEKRELEELLRRQKELMNQPANTPPAKEAAPDKTVPSENSQVNRVPPKDPEPERAPQEELRTKTVPSNEQAPPAAIVEQAKPAPSPSSVPVSAPVSEKIAQDARLNSRWSLEKCIQYAIDHNISIKQLQLQQEDAKIQYSTARNSRLPNVNASVDQEWSFGRQADLIGNYGTWNQSTLSFGVQSEIPIFTGFRIPNQVEHTRLEINVALQNLEKAKEDLSLNITSLFLQVLFSREVLKINEEQLDLSKTQVERTKLLIQAGSIPKSQLFDIEAQVAKDEVAVVNAQNDLDLALLDLAQSLELERNTNFDIYVPDFSDDVISRYESSLRPPDVIYEHALNIKPVILGQESKVESSVKALNVAKSGYYPQLSFSVGIGSAFNHVYTPKEQINLITNQPIVLNPPLSEQLKDYGSRLFAFHLTIPIFNRCEVRNQVRSAQINIMNQQLILENNKKTLYKEIQTAHKNATGARERYRASSRAVKSASESFDFVRRHYELGKATVFEFDEARTRYIQSFSEQVQAKYEYILRTKILDFYNGIPIRL
ncbi:MAG: TolC family protein [Candidatus Azobacteroides sp.]|nr:TolC family protein [Candidatus Azobacteroides sp.]